MRKPLWQPRAQTKAPAPNFQFRKNGPWQQRGVQPG
eukprot:CAMPEP_0202821354 /NCGR_PEP_ID=MMETSP1389-20130828/10325_1 /ASSEMBLY_ACC=CAM_ASM_000865 /TAXON_ID=302021 /ORGANISM="Rhodomonas sp., Strain CCMP768" /LENGTH=35 /DNA_ID= /DNA_START= /DNA_END= /DNA_ORIENTATION=